MKALERPPEWHRQKFLSLKETPVKCYLVFEYDKEDGEEYNRYFPFTLEGLKKAQKLAFKVGETVRTIEEKIEFLLPYSIQQNMQGNEFKEWCIKWGVNV